MSNRISSVRRPFRAIISAAAALTLVAACGSDSDGGAEENSGDNVTVSTNTGEKEVPLNPERVAVLDNTAMETVLEFDITPVAVPKPLIPEGIFGEWIGDDEIFDVGSHREPDFEALNESEPDVIIGGYRFEEYSDELEKIAPVVDVAPAGEAQSDYVSGLKNQTEVLGAIFDQDEAAEEIIGKFDAHFGGGRGAGFYREFLFAPQRRNPIYARVANLDFALILWCPHHCLWWRYRTQCAGSRALIRIRFTRIGARCDRWRLSHRCRSRARRSAGISGCH